MAKKPLEEAPPPRRGPRPSVEVRDVLLRAAADLVAERGLSDIPLRMVAERAGVTPAMVGYYFDRKDGLWDALVVSGMEAIRGAIAPSVLGQAGAPELAVVIEGVMRTLHARPWMPVLVLRSLWGAPKHRSGVALQQAPINLALMRTLLARARVDGRPLRSDVPVEAIILVIVSTTVFPVLARPVLERALGRPFDEAFCRELAQSVAALIAHPQEAP
ncbi:MAG: TetR/AcrR family transcriptional regulator [Polyangiales bacterium]|nr:TetR/AcrR family transcriptional regulator [Sandaracinaceae bacterium]